MHGASNTKLPFAASPQHKVDTASACCCRAVGEVVMAMTPNLDLHHIGMGNNLESSELLSKRQLRDRLDSFIGDAAGTEP